MRLENGHFVDGNLRGTRQIFYKRAFIRGGRGHLKGDRSLIRKGKVHVSLLKGIIIRGEKGGNFEKGKGRVSK